MIYREDPTDRTSVRVPGMLTQNPRRLTESGKEVGADVVQRAGLVEALVLVYSNEKDITEFPGETKA